MLRFAVDEDFDNRIVRGLLRLLPTLDIVRAQDAGLIGKLDPVILMGRGRNMPCVTNQTTTRRGILKLDESASQPRSGDIPLEFHDQGFLGLACEILVLKAGDDIVREFKLKIQPSRHKLLLFCSRSAEFKQHSIA